MATVLTVLGSGDGQPRPTSHFGAVNLRTAPAFVLTHGETRILLECGCGTMLRLQQLTDDRSGLRIPAPLTPLDFDAVFISHAHPEQIGELFYFAVEFARLNEEAGATR